MVKEGLVYLHKGLTCLCDIYFCGDARHSWMGKTLNRLDSYSPDSSHVSLQCAPKVEFCTWLSTCSPCTARDHWPCTSLQIFQPQDLHKKKQWQQDQLLAVFISSGTTVEFALVLFPRILCWAKLGTVRATVACRLYMLGFNMLPKTCLILGCPKTVFALPKVAQLDHFVWYCCLKIYREKLIEPHI